MPPDWRLFHVRRSTAKRLFFEVPYRRFACRQIAARVGRKFTGIHAGVGFSSRSEDDTSVGFYRHLALKAWLVELPKKKLLE